MMFRYIILSVLLITRQAVSQTDDEDEKTLEWLKAQNNQSTANVDDILKWVSSYIPNENNTKTTTFNLDPTNVVIKNVSLSHPSEASKFDRKKGVPEMEVDKQCTTEDGRTGVCVLYYQCDPNTRNVIVDGTTIIDIRSGEKDCSTYMHVCCSLQDRLDVSAEKQRPLSPAADPLRIPGECGWNNPDLFVFKPPNKEVADRGYYANYGDFPWMVALLKQSDTSVWVQNDYIGGGSLIHPSVVLTAYHKLMEITPEKVKCRAGEWDTQTVNELYQVQERDADRFVSHKKFFVTSLHYDIALVFLKTPFDLAKAPHIGTACLSRELPDPGTLCFSMGWGKDVKTNATSVNILKKIRVPLVEHEHCRQLLHTNTRFRHIPYFVLDKSLTCAGGEEHVDTCTGDGGSSLVCAIGNRGGRTRYAVVGLVAYGLDCGKKDVPGVYVNVPYLYDWVDEQMRDAGYPTGTYSF